MKSLNLTSVRSPVTPHRLHRRHMVMFSCRSWLSRRRFWGAGWCRRRRTEGWHCACRGNWTERALWTAEKALLMGIYWERKAALCPPAVRAQARRTGQGKTVFHIPQARRWMDIKLGREPAAKLNAKLLGKAPHKCLLLQPRQCRRAESRPPLLKCSPAWAAESALWTSQSILNCPFFPYYYI